jgi:holliday junction DNA helicase RuvA
MIEYLQGVLVSKSPGHAVILVQGVGYGADITLAAEHGLPAIGQPTELFTYLYVQEGIFRLYGFAAPYERELFEIFISTSGIGPKTALVILSSLPVAEFARAILNSDLRVLTKIPGIGKKTAERLTIELRDKMPAFAAIQGDAPNAISADGLSGATGPASSRQQDAIAALIELGCRQPVAERAVFKATEILGNDAAVPKLVREALKHRY